MKRKLPPYWPALLLGFLFLALYFGLPVLFEVNN